MDGPVCLFKNGIDRHTISSGRASHRNRKWGWLRGFSLLRKGKIRRSTVTRRNLGALTHKIFSNFAVNAESYFGIDIDNTTEALLIAIIVDNARSQCETLVDAIPGFLIGNRLGVGRVGRPNAGRGVARN
jgi:hypothetical protein